MPPAKKRLPLQVMAYFRLGEDDPGAVPGRPAGARTINHVSSRHLEKHGSISYTADTAATGSSLAMSFEEAGAHFTSSDLYLTETDYFILEAWVRVNRVKDVPTVIVYNGRGDQDGYGLITIGRRWQFMFGGVCFGDSGIPCEVGKWTHLALVCERGRSQLWVNGRPAGQVVNVLPNVPTGPFTIGGIPVSQNPTQCLDGQIDEVRLSEFLAPFRPEMLLLPPIHNPPPAVGEVKQVNGEEQRLENEKPVNSRERRAADMK
jgi:hypothetical protein